jgi:hypothetical protein
MKSYVGPNLHAERKRQKIKDFLGYTDKDLYGFFTRLKQQNPQLEKYSNREIAGWIHEAGKLMAGEVVTQRRGVMLPGLGAVVTGICKPTKKTAMHNLDYQMSQKLGVEFFHRNAHTDGHVGKIYYTNNIPRCKFKNHQQWTFKPCRALSRAVSAAMKIEGNYRNYIRFSKQLPVHKIFSKDKRRKANWRHVKAEKERLSLLAEYNEFDFS